MQPLDCPSEQETGRTESGPAKKESKQFKRRCSSESPKFELELQRFHSGAATDGPEINNTKVAQNPEIVWKQPLSLF